MWRLIAAAVLLVFAFAGVPSAPAPAPSPAPAPEKPTPDLQSAVADVKTQLSRYSAQERALWSELWTAVAEVATDPVTTSSITDTVVLRNYQVEMLKIGWIVLGEHTPGANPSLDAAVNAAFASVLTTEERPVNSEVIYQYAALCRALAWAGR